jgi:hypothetical protein
MDLVTMEITKNRHKSALVVTVTLRDFISEAAYKKQAELKNQFLQQLQ